MARSRQKRRKRYQEEYKKTSRKKIVRSKQKAGSDQKYSPNNSTYGD